MFKVNLIIKNLIIKKYSTKNNNSTTKNSNCTKLVSNVIFTFSFLLFLLNFTYAQFTPISGPGQELSRVWFSTDIPWQILAMIAVLFSFSFSAISYMFGKLFQLSDLEKLAKSEFIYAISSLLIVVFLITIVDVLAVKSASFILTVAQNDINLYNFVSNNPSPFIATEYYLNASLSCFILRYQEAFCLDIFPAMTAETNLISNAIHNSLVRLMSDFAYLTYTFFFQKNLLLLIQQTMLTIFLPVGVVLRGFPFVRSIGNTFIAVAIGLYFVYPITYLILIALFNYSSISQSFCFAYYNIETTQNQYTISIPCVTGLIKDVIAHSAQFISNSYSPDYNIISAFTSTVQQFIGEMMILGVVFPIISATLTYTFIRSFAVFLNVDVGDLMEGLFKLI